jgi:ATP-dependent Clp protease ATP-binding subunit ClpC
MPHLEPGVVLKYFEPLDHFVKIRRFSPEEIGRLLSTAKISDRRGYIGLVVNACVLDLSPRLLEREDALYEVCVDVNPALDIRKVTIAAGAEHREIHLLEAPASAAPPRDFRRLRDMEDVLREKVVGQEPAIACVSRALKKAMTGLRDPERPIAALFFVGQTGVGKTELAKALTLCLFRDPARMLRVDCSEYALPHEYAKLIGAPPGYVGHDHPGVLNGVARSSEPMTVLFDEIEKSDGKVRDLLLQAMDEGFVTDNRGGRLPFGHTVLIFTSNVGCEEAEALKHRIGFAPEGAERAELVEEFSRAVKANFRPEFVNRLTEVVFFNPIGLPECEKIARKFLEEVRRHAENVPLDVRYDERVPRWLAERSFRPEYGARELRRTVEKEVEGALSDMLVEGRLDSGDTVTIKVSRDRLRFHRN